MVINNAIIIYVIVTGIGFFYKLESLINVLSFQNLLSQHLLSYLISVLEINLPIISFLTMSTVMHTV